MDENNEAPELLSTATNEVQGVNTIPGGMNAQDPEAQAAMNQALKLRGMDYARAGIGALGAGSAAAAGTTNPLAAMIQGIAAGMQIPAQIYKEKREQLKTTIDATPFGEVVPEAKNPDSPYAILAGIPYGLASKAIQAIATEAVKSGLQGKTELAKVEAERAKEYPRDEKQINAFVEATGLPANIVSQMRVSALEKYAESKAQAPEKKREKMQAMKSAFNSQPAVKTWDTIKPNVGTINSIAAKLQSTGTLTPTEQSQLMIAFKDIATLGGGAARMTEDTLNIVENKGRWGQIVDAITSGAAVSLTPAEARDVVNAASYKINAVKSGYMDEKAKFRDILLPDDKVTQDFIFDEGVEAPTMTMNQPKPGQLITEEVDGEIVVYRVNPDGKTKKRVK